MGRNSYLQFSIYLIAVPRFGRKNIVNFTPVYDFMRKNQDNPGGS